MPGKTFVSYARADQAFVLGFVKVLAALGIELWIDQVDIRPGENWDDAVLMAVNSCERVLVFLSKASVASKNVKDEIATALDRGVPIIPVLIEECEIPLRLRRMQRIDLVSADVTVGAEAVRALISQYPAGRVERKGRKQKLSIVALTVTVLGVTVSIGITTMRSILSRLPAMSVELDRKVDYSYSTCIEDGRHYNLKIVDAYKFSAEVDSYSPTAIVPYPTQVRLFDDLQGSRELPPKVECKETNDKLPQGTCAKSTYEWSQGAVVRNRQAELSWLWTATEPVRFRNVDTKARFPITLLRLTVTLPRDSTLTEPPVLIAPGGRCALVSREVRGFVAECQPISSDQPMHETISAQLPQSALDCPK